MAKHDLDDATTTAKDPHLMGPDDGEGAFSTLAARAADVVEKAGSVAQTLPAQVDRASLATGRAIEEATHTLQNGSDDALLAGASVMAGLALGLVIGRAPHVVIGLALVPALAMAATFAQRREQAQTFHLDRPLVH